MPLEQARKRANYMQSRRKKLKANGNHWNRRWTKSRENQEGKKLVFCKDWKINLGKIIKKHIGNTN